MWGIAISNDGIGCIIIITHYFKTILCEYPHMTFPKESKLLYIIIALFSYIITYIHIIEVHKYIHIREVPIMVIMPRWLILFANAQVACH